MLHRILNQWLNGQSRHEEIGGFYIVYNIQIIIKPQFLQFQVTLYIFEFLIKRNRCIPVYRFQDVFQIF